MAVTDEGTAYSVPYMREMIDKEQCPTAESNWTPTSPQQLQLPTGCVLDKVASHAQAKHFLGKCVEVLVASLDS